VVKVDPVPRAIAQPRCKVVADEGQWPFAPVEHHRKHVARGYLGASEWAALAFALRR
jgi:hypothetical protein